MEKAFRPYNPNQKFLFPRSLDEYVQDDDLSIFVRELVMEQLDLSEIYGGYSESQGLPPFNPTMMTALLLYSYSQGIYSSELTESTNGNKDSTRRTPLPISVTKANR